MAHTLSLLVHTLKEFIIAYVQTDPGGENEERDAGKGLVRMESISHPCGIGEFLRVPSTPSPPLLRGGREQ